MTTDQAAYMREYRARKKAEKLAAAGKVNPHEQCDRRIADLEAEVAVWKARAHNPLWELEEAR